MTQGIDILAHCNLKLDKLKNDLRLVRSQASFKGFLNILVFVGLMLLGTAACGELSEEEKQQIEEAMSDSLLTSTESWGVEMSLIKDGHRNITIAGDRAEKYHLRQRPYTEVVGSVSLVLYDTLRQMTSEISCQRALYYQEQGTFEFYEDVVVHTNDSLVLRTSFLKWVDDTDKIYSPEFVTITTPTDSIAGVGFQSDTDFQNYTIRESSGEVIVEE